MGPVMKKLAALQDELRRASDEAKAKKPGCMAELAETAALATYQAFMRDTALDFEIMARAASERPASMDWLADLVATLLVDRMNFDAVAAQANFANKAVMEAKHKAEDLGREVAELRKMVDRLMILDEQRGKRAVA